MTLSEHEKNLTQATMAFAEAFAAFGCEVALSAPIRGDAAARDEFVRRIGEFAGLMQGISNELVKEVVRYLGSEGQG